MRSERPDLTAAAAFAGRWVGIALTLVGVVAVLLLAASGRLTLYVHPRYVVFTVVMSLVAGVVATAAAVVGPASHPDHDHHDHDHDHDHDHGAPPGRAPALGTAAPWRSGLALASRLVAVGAAVVALLVLPPAGLSGSLRQDRDLDGSTAAPDVSTAKSLVGGDPGSFSVKDWSVLLRRGDPQTLVGKPVHVSGYVIDQSSSELWVGRLLITCCAVDARPVGVPVSLPGWHDRFAVDDWVELTGSFVANPDPGSTQPVVVKVTNLTKVAEPAQQYVY